MCILLVTVPSLSRQQPSHRHCPGLRHPLGHKCLLWLSCHFTMVVFRLKGCKTVFPLCHFPLCKIQPSCFLAIIHTLSSPFPKSTKESSLFPRYHLRIHSRETEVPQLQPRHPDVNPMQAEVNGKQISFGSTAGAPLLSCSGWGTVHQITPAGISLLHFGILKESLGKPFALRLSPPFLFSEKEQIPQQLPGVHSAPKISQQK